MLSGLFRPLPPSSGFFNGCKSGERRFHGLQRSQKPKPDIWHIIERERAATQNQPANLQTLYAAQEIEIKRLTRELDRMKKLETQIKELKQKNAELHEQLKTAYKY